jgi:hypothetical protein
LLPIERQYAAFIQKCRQISIKIKIGRLMADFVKNWLIFRNFCNSSNDVIFSPIFIFSKFLAQNVSIIPFVSEPKYFGPILAEFLADLKKIKADLLKSLKLR